jgi:hypothetical protein
MRFIKCNQDDRFCNPNPEGNRKYCSGKLPCGRCASGSNPCGDTELKEFDCDNCLYRFICLTTSYEVDHKKGVYPINGNIVKWRG